MYRQLSNYSVLVHEEQYVGRWILYSVNFTIQNAGIGEKKVWYAPRVWVEGEDAAAATEGQVITLINWGNVVITKVNK